MKQNILKHWEIVWKFFDEWSRDKSIFSFLIILPVMVFLSWQMIFNEEHTSLFSAVNLGIHEMGHMVFGLGGQFIGILGGTILQCLAPLFVMVVLLQGGDIRAVPFCGTWLASNLYNVSIYIADARARALSLVNPFSPDPIHDWNYILSKLRLLRFDTKLAWIVDKLAFLCAIGSIILCTYMIFRMTIKNQKIL